MNAVLGDASALPFEDGSFDIAYCSFTLLWVKDPQKVIREMVQVSRRFVVCLAEPDYGGRISHPKEVADLDRYLVESLVEEGADPFIGRKLGTMLERAGLQVEMGVHSGVWSPGQLKYEAKAEWDSIVRSVKERAETDVLEKAKAVIRTFPATELGSRMLLLDNWNEWSEGSYLEPDTVHGMAYLEAVRDSLLGTATS